MHQYSSQLSLASNVNREQVFDYSLDLLAKCSAYASAASGELTFSQHMLHIETHKWKDAATLPWFCHKGSNKIFVYFDTFCSSYNRTFILCALTCTPATFFLLVPPLFLTSIITLSLEQWNTRLATRVLCSWNLILCDELLNAFFISFPRKTIPTNEFSSLVGPLPLTHGCVRVQILANGLHVAWTPLEDEFASLSTTTVNVTSVKNNSIDLTVEDGVTACHEYFDSVLCWPRVSAGTIAKISCRQVFTAMGVPPPKNSLDAIVTIHDQAIRFQGESHLLIALCFRLFFRPNKSTLSPRKSCNST